jgi:hypothetical protein
VLATIKFKGFCNVTEAALEGSVIGEAWSGGGAVKMGLEPGYAVENEVNFPNPAIKRMWTESEGKMLGHSGGLALGCQSFEGRSGLTLLGSEKWQVRG